MYSYLAVPQLGEEPTVLSQRWLYPAMVLLDTAVLRKLFQALEDSETALIRLHLQP